MNRPLVRVHITVTNNEIMAHPTGPYLQLGDFVIVDDDGCVTKAARIMASKIIGVVTGTEYQGCLIIWNEKAA